MAPVVVVAVVAVVVEEVRALHRPSPTWLVLAAALRHDQVVPTAILQEAAALRSVMSFVGQGGLSRYPVFQLLAVRSNML